MLATASLTTTIRRRPSPMRPARPAVIPAASWLSCPVLASLATALLPCRLRSRSRGPEKRPCPFFGTRPPPKARLKSTPAGPPRVNFRSPRSCACRWKSGDPPSGATILRACDSGADEFIRSLTNLKGTNMTTSMIALATVVLSQRLEHLGPAETDAASLGWPDGHVDRQPAGGVPDRGAGQRPGAEHAKQGMQACKA